MRGQSPAPLGSQPAGRERVVMGVLAALLVGVGLVSLVVGSYGLTVERAASVVGDYLGWWLSTLPQRLQALASGGAAPAYEAAKDAVVLLGIRLPRVLVAALSGAALAAAGAAYQGMFKNPMVSPDVLGVSNGASVGAALGLLWGLSSWEVHALSFACGLAAVATVMLLARRLGRGSSSTVVIILAGMVMSSLFQAVVSMCKYVADPDDALLAITYWLMGSFSRSGASQTVWMLALVLLVAGGVLMALRWRINVLSFGDDEAKALGVNVRATRNAVIAAATLLTSATVSYCGVVGWIGLIVPHMMRLVVGPNYKALLPASMLGGAVFTVVADDFARTIVAGELPIGVLTALVGAPLFVWMLARGRKEWL